MSQPSDKSVPPQSLDAEASLLGAILIDSEAVVKVADSVKHDDFYDQKHQHIYRAIIGLYDAHAPIDVLTLSNKLQEMGFFEIIGGASYLT